MINTKLGWTIVLFSLLSGCHNIPLKKSNQNDLSNKKIIFLPFQSSNPYIPGALISDIFANAVFDKNIPIDILQIMEGQKTTQKGRMRSNDTIGINNEADLIVTGSINTLETIQSQSGKISIQVKALNARNGKIVWIKHMVISENTLFSYEIPTMADKIMRKAGEKLAEAFYKSMLTSVSYETLAGSQPILRKN